MNAESLMHIIQLVVFLSVLNIFRHHGHGGPSGYAARVSPRGEAV